MLLYKNEIDKCYQRSKFKNNFYFIEIDGLKIPIKHNSKRIMINLSGGADSAILTHLLCNHIREQKLDIEVHVLQFIRKWITAPWQGQIGLDVYNYLSNKFSDITFKRYEALLPTCIEGTFLINSDDDGNHHFNTNWPTEIDAMNEIAEYYVTKNDIDTCYNAVTCNPSVPLNWRVHTRDLVCKGTKKDAERLIYTFDQIGQNKKNTVSRYLCCPFSYVDKSWVIKQYKDNNLIDMLNITRSCESVADKFNFPNWNGVIEDLIDCNKECFWCLERNWALEQNNLLQYKNKHGKLIIT